jgi:hypothetical protein
LSLIRDIHFAAIAISLCVAIVTGTRWLVAQASQMADLRSRMVFFPVRGPELLADTDFGHIWIVRMVLTAELGGMSRFARLRPKSAPKRVPAVLLAAIRWIIGLHRPCGRKLALRARFIGIWHLLAAGWRPQNLASGHRISRQRRAQLAQHEPSSMPSRTATAICDKNFVRPDASGRRSGVIPCLRL